MTDLTPARIFTFEAQTYAFAARTVALPDLGVATQDGLAETAAAVADTGLERRGAAFVRYRRIDMAGTLDIEAGIPVADPGNPLSGIFLGRLPAGNRARLAVHRGWCASGVWPEEA